MRPPQERCYMWRSPLGVRHHGRCQPARRGPWWHMGMNLAWMTETLKGSSMFNQPHENLTSDSKNPMELWWFFNYSLMNFHSNVGCNYKNTDWSWLVYCLHLLIPTGFVACGVAQHEVNINVKNDGKALDSELSHVFSKETQLILLAMYHYTSQYTPVYPLYPYIYLDTIITHYTLKISNYTYPINSNYILYIPSIPVYDIDILMLYISHFSPIKSP